MYHILLKHRGVNLQCWKLVAIKTLLDVWYVLNAQYTVFEKLVSTLYNIVRIQVQILISFTDLISERGIKVLTCSTENEMLQNNNKAIILACFNDLAVLTAGLHCKAFWGSVRILPICKLIAGACTFCLQIKTGCNN